MKKPVLKSIETLYDHKYLKLYAADYDNGAHYLITGRRGKDDLLLNMTEEELKKTHPDAVTVIVIVKMPKKKPKLLFHYEYRYPAGTFLISPVAGLIDAEDRDTLSREEAIRVTAIRETFEETGITVGPKDTVEILNPFLLMTPGMTDESNALACVTVSVPDESVLSQDGAEGTEVFNGFALLNRNDAKRMLKNGTDDRGIPFSIQTWAALLYFISCVK